MSEKKSDRPKPVVLIILDGWGIAPPVEGNAIAKSDTPNMDKFIKTYPAMPIIASGQEVGLSWGEIGNSEVGHLNIGAGQVFYQKMPRIDKEIRDGAFFKNDVLLGAIKHAKKNKSKLHYMGLVSEGGVHSHEKHLFALLELAKKEKFKEVYIHAFLDGRDAIYNSGLGFIKELQKKMKEYKVGKIASLSGRYYAMDRDKRWDRTEKAYLAITEGKSEEKYDDPIKAIETSYGKEIYDEEFVPTVITDKKDEPVATVDDGDAVVFFNFRADRARQLTEAFTNPDFKEFERSKFIKDLYFATMMQYDAEFEKYGVKVAFPDQVIEYPLARVISEAGLKQLHIAETEKYAHVTFFFNALKEEPFKGEDRVIIPSPKVASYDKKPEMSAKKIASRVIKEINTDKYDFIVLNFANPDMVSHTGDLEASIEAIETCDKLTGDIVDAVLSKDGVALITADHGNAEEVVNLQTGDIDKEHSTNPVPFIIIGKQFEGKSAGLPDTGEADLSLMQPVGMLSDIAPTTLKIMNIKKPDEMTGNPLI